MVSIGRKIVGVALVYTFTLIYTFTALFKLVLRVLFRGKTYFNVKPRPVPPSCLNDPALGRHNYIKLKDVKLHYVEAGDNTKPLIVFLHGYPEFWYSWRNQIPALKDSFWTVAVDMRGYGDSDKPSGIRNYAMNKLVGDVKQLVDNLGRTSCTLVAHDWGGLVAWVFATEFPKMVDRLVILNAPHPVAFNQQILSSFRQFLKSWYIFFYQMPFLPEILMHMNDIEILDRAFLSHPKGKEVFCDHVMEAFKYTFAKRSDFTGPLNYYRNLGPGLLIPRDEEAVKRVTVPVLIIWGTDDLALTESMAEMSKQYCDNCTIKRIKGASHWVQQDSPAEVNKHIIEFLKGKQN